MKKYVFFIREYNDWDNIAPIIYYLANSGISKIYICFYRTDLRHTDLFKYLEKNFADTIKVFHRSSKKMFPVVDFAIKILNKLSKFLRLKKKFLINKNLPYNELTKWLDIIKKEKGNRVIIVFDRMLEPILKQVREYLKDLDTIFISCPHGPETNVNRMKYIHQMKRIEKNPELLEYFKAYEYLIFSDHLELELSEKYSAPFRENVTVDKSKLVVLGSIRYCKEWLKHVDKFTKSVVNEKTGKIKVVFFMKKFVHNVFKDEVYRTIELFAAFPKIDFYIKPHTRGMKFSSKINAPNIHIDNESSSSYLINMADVVFFYGGTSIILESIAKKKFTVCLDYLDTNLNVYDHFNACKVLKCRDDLSFFLNSDIPKKLINNKIAGDKLLEEIIYARNNSISVPDRYINFFKKL